MRASLWEKAQVDFQWLQGDLFRFEPSEWCMSETEIRLARSQPESDIRWQLGAVLTRS